MTLLALMTAAFMYLGFSLMRRKVDPSVKRYMISFSLWWIILGTITSVIGLGFYVLGFLNILAPALYLAYVYVVLIALSMSLLINYLGFIYLGRGKALRIEKIAASAYYTALTAYMLYITYLQGPYPVFSEFGGIAIKYDVMIDQVFPGAVIVTLLLIYIPQFIVLGLLFKLRSKISEPTQKYRISLVAASITIWFAYGFITTLIEVSGSTTIKLIGRCIQLSSAVVVLFAYFPPNFVQKRGITPLEGT